MKSLEFFEREFTNNIGVQDEKVSFVTVFLQNVLGQSNRSSCAKRFGFLRTVNGYIVFVLEVINVFEHVFRLVSDSQNDFLHSRIRQSLDLML